MVLLIMLLMFKMYVNSIKINSFILLFLYNNNYLL